MSVPYTFGAATTAIPLSQLDSNFATTITLGNTAIQLGNTVTTLNNMTLANVTISSGNVTITNVSVTTANVGTVNATTVIATTGNITTVNATTVVATTANATTANITTGNLTDLTLTNNPTLSGGTANGVLYLNGSKVATSGSALTFDGTNVTLGTGGSVIESAKLTVNNRITVANNSASNRGIYIDGGSDAGGFSYIYTNSSTRDLAFGTDATERMRLTSTGLGIGTNNPGYKVTAVVGSGSDAFFADANNQSYSGYRIRAGVSGQQWAFRGGTTTMALTDVTASADRMVIDTSGNVGIGTSSPGTLLQIGSTTVNASAKITLGKTTATTEGTLPTVYAGSLINPAAGVDLVLEAGSTSGGVAICTAGSTRAVIDASGNLGLGVTPSAWMLPTIETQSQMSFGTFGMGRNVYYATGYASKYITAGYASRYSQSSGTHIWETAASGTAGNAITFTQAMTLDASGNLGVGTTSQLAKLDVVGTGINVTGNVKAVSRFLQDQTTYRGVGIGYDSSGQVGVIYPESAGAGSSLAFWTYSGSGWNERARIDNSGNLLVGTTSAAWSIAGSVNATGYACRAGQSGSFSGNGFNINWTGNPILWIDSTNVGQIATTSDYRIKQNVKTQTTTALDRIAQIRPVTYELADYKDLWRADGVTREGFIAHELQIVIPSAVEGEKDAENQIQSLRLDALCSVLVKAIQELNAKVQALESQLKGV